MSNSYIDWNFKLLSDIHEFNYTSQETLVALSYLQKRFEIKSFCVTPTFHAESDSVATFLLRRDKAIAELADAATDPNLGLRKPIKIMEGASVLLAPELHEILNLKKLTIPFNSGRYLPIKLPYAEHADWIDLELNRLLYRAEMKLFFLSFEIACIFYPPDVLEKLMRISNAVYQFNYSSLSNPKVRAIMSKLLAQKATVVFGTSLNVIDKIYHYEFDYYLESAKQNFRDFEYAELLKYNQTLPKKHPKLHRLIGAK